MSCGSVHSSETPPCRFPTQFLLSRIKVGFVLLNQDARLFLRRNVRSWSPTSSDHLLCLSTGAASVLLLFRDGPCAELTPGHPAPPDAKEGIIEGRHGEVRAPGGHGYMFTVFSLYAGPLLSPSWDQVCLSNKSPHTTGATPGPWLQEVAGKSPVLSTPTPSSWALLAGAPLVVHLGQALCCLLSSPKCKITAGIMSLYRISHT